MAIMRIISRSILRKSSTFSTLRCFSTATEAPSSPAPAKSKRPNVLFDVVVRRRSANCSIADALNKWVDEGKHVKKGDLINLSIYFRNYKNFSAALQLHEWAESSKLGITDADRAVRIDLLSKTEGVASAEKYFNSLQESEKNNKTYGALLNCYCKERLLDKALEVFEIMKALKYTSTLNYSNLIVLFNNSGQPEKALSLVQEMEDNNIPPDMYTYNLLINSYAALKEFDAMEGVLKKMTSRDIIPDSFTYGNLATMFFNAGLHEKAIAILELMEQIEIKYDKGAVEGCCTRLRLYSMMNDLSGVIRAWEALKSVYPTPSNTNYLIMLLALSKLGEKENLEKIYKEWEEGCSRYDFRLPSVLLEYFLGRNMIEEATSLYKSVKTRADEPNLRALGLFSIICIKNGQLDLALKYLEMGVAMTLDKSKPWNKKWFLNDETVTSFVDYFEAISDTDKAEKFIQIMKKHGSLDSNPLLLNFKALDAGN
ncbi:hypothetical protein ACS0TY_002208 [Phlomoides rotata]